MEIKIYDKTLNLIGILDKYNSFVWVRKYSNTGNFKMVAPFTLENMQLLQIDNIVSKDISEGGFIDGIKITEDEEGNKLIEITGKHITGYLERRIIWGMEDLRGNAEDAIRRLVNNNAITTPTERIIPLLQLGDKSNLTQQIQKQITGDNLLNAINEIAETVEMGFDINTNYLTKKINFVCYNGIDRTINQSTVAPCIFSNDYENILGQEYIKSLGQYKNVTLVMGTGEGSNRKRVSVGQSSGLNRYELFTDARDISEEKTVSTPTGNKDENGNTIYQDTKVAISLAEYQELLKQRGNEKLKDCYKVESYESTVNTKSNSMLYKIDYNLGDKVTVIDRELGIQLNTRIVEIEEIYEETGNKINLTFGSNTPTIIDMIRRG